MPLSPMLEESRGLAEQLLENLKPADDAAVIHRVDDMLRRTNDVRAKVVDDAQATLKALSRQLELAKDSAERPKRELEANQHADRMAALDREKYALARNVGEVDATIESLESELGQLQAELAALEAEEKAEAEIPPTEQQLKLKVFRSLGIELQKDLNGDYKKAIVRAMGRRDIQIMEFDSKYSRFYYANVLWDMCS